VRRWGSCASVTEYDASGLEADDRLDGLGPGGTG